MTNTRRVARVNGAAAVGIFVLLIAVSLVVKPPTPPTIAEFAPQAQQQIEEAPDEQSAESGAAVAGARQTIVIEETEAAVDAEQTQQRVVLEESVPSALQCVTWPDGSVTQTFDPQSPPCIADWDFEAGNGGATWRGVTKDEIQVAVIATPDDGDGYLGAFELYQNLFDWFNTHFQLYGRRVVAIPVEENTSSSNNSRADPVAQRANAVDAIATGAFAAFQHEESHDDITFLRTLADAGMIVTASGTGLTPTATLESMAPFVWSFTSTWDARQRGNADMICSQLAGRNAAYAGPDVNGTPRGFAIMLPNLATTRGERQPEIQPLLDALEACGVQPLVGEYGTDEEDAAANTQTMLEFRNAGVTTIMAILYGGNSIQPMFQAASALSYQPEWILGGTTTDRKTTAFTQSPADQVSHMFGAFPFNPPIPYAVQPSVRVYRESGASPDLVIFPDWVYERMLLLFSGLQMAGPNLTPETFEAGLLSTTWPNPGAGERPYYKGEIDFKGGRTAMNDLAPYWYSSSARQNNEWYGATPGSFCFVGGGVRHALGEWPSQPRFFETATC